MSNSKISMNKTTFQLNKNQQSSSSTRVIDVDSGKINTNNNNGNFNENNNSPKSSPSRIPTKVVKETLEQSKLATEKAKLIQLSHILDNEQPEQDFPIINDNTNYPLEYEYAVRLYSPTSEQYLDMNRDHAVTMTYLNQFQSYYLRIERRQRQKKQEQIFFKGCDIKYLENLVKVVVKMGKMFF